MRTQSLWLIFLVSLLFSSPLLATDKEVFYEAIEALENEQELTAEQFEMLKNANHNFSPQSELDEFGGPDEYGYTYIDSWEDPEGPVFEWIEISDVGTNVTIGDDDYTDPPIALPWPFNYYGNAYNDVFICSNGYLSFGEGSEEYWGFSIPNNQEPNNYIAFFAYDLNPEEGGMIYYYYDEILDVFIVQFDAIVEYWNGPGTITAEVILYPNGDIIMQYDELGNGINIDEECIGIENSDGNIGLQVSSWELPPAYPYNGLAILFTRGDPDANVSGVVTDVDSGEPVTGAEVMVGGGYDVTDEGGNYSIEGIYSMFENYVNADHPHYFHHNDTVILIPGENIHNIQLTPLAPPQTQDYCTDFEDGQGYFEPLPGNFSWEYGEPVLYPPGTFSPTHCWGIYLDLDIHGVWNDELLATTESWHIRGEDAFFGYYHTYNYQYLFNGYNVRISTDDGLTWSLITPSNTEYPNIVMALDEEEGFSGENESGYGNWDYVEFDLSQYVDHYVRIAFRNATTEQYFFFPGAAIDDFCISVGSGPLTLTAIPWDEQPWVGPTGGNIRWDAYVENVSDDTYNFDAWTELILPNGMEYGPLDLFEDLTLPSGLFIEASPNQQVPGIAPNGIYTFIARVGQYDLGQVDAEDSFEFAKLPLPGPTMGKFNNGEGWALSGWIALDEMDKTVTNVNLPTEYCLENIFPNPFNPTATITFGIPETACVKISIYNVLGKRVQELKNNYLNAGYHSVTFDGTDFSSGIYFIHAEVPGKMNDIRKMILMK